jgi:cytochrome b
MVWLLWSLVLALGVTGWMTRLDAFWGDETLHDVHAWLAHALSRGGRAHIGRRRGDEPGAGARTWCSR